MSAEPLDPAAIMANHYEVKWWLLGADGFPDKSSPLPSFCAACSETKAEAIEAGEAAEEADAHLAGWPCLLYLLADLAFNQSEDLGLAREGFEHDQAKIRHQADALATAEAKIENALTKGDHSLNCGCSMYCYDYDESNCTCWRAALAGDPQ